MYLGFFFFKNFLQPRPILSLIGLDPVFGSCGSSHSVIFTRYVFPISDYKEARFVTLCILFQIIQNDLFNKG